MAVDPQIEQDLNRLEASLNNLAGVINDRILNKLSDTKDRTREWLNEFEKGKDISKKVGDKLGELQRESNKLALNRIKLETDLARAQRLNLTNAERKIREALRANTLADQEIDKAQTLLYNLQRTTEEKKKQNNISEILKKKLEDIKLTYFTTLGILKFILDAGLRFNKVSVEAGKNLGYGADQADRVTQNLANAANSSGNLNFTLKNAAAAMSELNAATGGVAEYSADTLETQIMLTKQLGLSGEEAAGIYKFSVLTGKASSQINDEMAGAFASTRNLVKGSANFKTTMAEVAKVSGQLAINFKNNPAEITKAVVQAQALGTTLEQTKEQGKQLLEFESSIENELKAELLTGQQLNLERARAAALMGDQVTVMKELANQGMTLEKFQNMNVLAQESFAKALGLSADALSDQLRKQKIAQEQGKSLAQITKEEALEAEKRQAIQDKFNAAIEKLQDLIGNLVAGPVGKFLEILTDIVSNTVVLSSILGGVLFVNVIKLVKAFRSGAIVSIIENAMKTFSGVPFAGFALATAAAAGGIAFLNSKMADDMIQPGYGKRTIMSPEGSIALNDNDTIIAGTNLGGGAGVDLTPMINAINQVKASVDRLYSKDTSISMDGKKVGTTLTQGSTKLA